MITGYHRPTTLDEALSLLARPSPRTFPMGGGTKLNQPSTQSFEVVDLQALAAQPDLGLGQIRLSGNLIELGAAVSLQQVSESVIFPQSMRTALNQALRNELTYNLRQVATVGGTLVSSSARSGLAVVFSALDALLEVATHQDGLSVVSLGDFLALRRELRPGGLIIRIKIQSNSTLTYAAVSRTPSDFPLVSTAVARWPSGRSRIFLGGYGQSPRLVLDGPDADGAGIAAREAFRDAGDEWASSEYRSAMAEILTNRCLTLHQEIMND